MPPIKFFYSEKDKKLNSVQQRKYDKLLEILVHDPTPLLATTEQHLQTLLDPKTTKKSINKLDIPLSLNNPDHPHFSYPLEHTYIPTEVLYLATPPLQIEIETNHTKAQKSEPPPPAQPSTPSPSPPSNTLHELNTHPLQNVIATNFPRRNSRRRHNNLPTALIYNQLNTFLESQTTTQHDTTPAQQPDTPAPNIAQPPTIGTKVEGLWKGDKWYPAKIKAVKGEYFQLTWDDGVADNTYYAIEDIRLPH